MHHEAVQSMLEARFHLRLYEGAKSSLELGFVLQISSGLGWGGAVSSPLSFPDQTLNSPPKKLGCRLKRKAIHPVRLGMISRNGILVQPSLCFCFKNLNK